MSHEDLPLFRWAPPACQVIAFPAMNRVGHARKIAEQLAKARTNREADQTLSRPVQAYVRQLRAAGVPPEVVEQQHEEFLRSINRQCLLLNAKWLPIVDGVSSDHRPGGDAA